MKRFVACAALLVVAGTGCKPGGDDDDNNNTSSSSSSSTSGGSGSTSGTSSGSSGAVSSGGSSGTSGSVSSGGSSGTSGGSSGTSGGSSGASAVSQASSGSGTASSIGPTPPCVEDTTGEPNDDPAHATPITLTAGVAVVQASACHPASGSSSGGTASSGTPASSAGTASSAAPASSMGTASSQGASSGAAACIPDPATGSAPTGAPGDDWFSVTIPANNSVDITLAITWDEDLDLFVFEDPSGVELGHSSGTTQTETVALEGSGQSRNLWIRVQPYSSVGSAYTLTVTTTAVTPPTRPANDLCADAITVTAGSYTGDTTDAANNHAFGGTGCTGWPTVGNEVFYKVNIPNNQTLTATLTSAADLSIYVLDACTGSCCWAGVDTSGTEDLTFQNTTGATRDFWLVVDSYSGSAADTFTLDIAIQ